MQDDLFENAEDMKVVELENGMRQLSFRCKERFEMPIGTASLRGPSPSTRSEITDTDAESDTTSTQESGRGSVIEGVASSTSVDFYGTEMSSEALTGMAKQMSRGIPLLPRHQSLSGGGTAEWDEVIGRTVEAQLVPRSVDSPAESSEPQYVLKSTSVLYDGEPLANSLKRRLERGEPIGQSIGGWFTNVRVLQDDEGEISRVIVDDVELDHLAITRAPANPDSRGLYTLRSRAEAFTRSLNSDVGQLPRVRAEDDAPNYRESEQADESCKTCESFDGGQCLKYDFETKPAMLCDTWESPEGESLPDETERAMITDDITTRSSPADEDLPLAPMEMEWEMTSGDEDEILGEEGNDWDRYAKAHFYAIDEEDREKKDAWKLPFAKMIDGKLTAVWRGVAAAMGALNGARGGVDIPDDQLDEVYDKISEYYRRFDKEAPPLERSIVETIDTDSPNGVSDERSLDAKCETVYHDSDDALVASDDKPADAQRGANPDPLKTPIKDDKMTNEDFERISELISRSVDGLVERVSSIEENLSAKTESAPAVEPSDEEPTVPAVSDETIKLRSKLEIAERRLARLAEYGVRHGVHSTAQVVEPARGPGADSEWRSLLDAQKEESGLGHLGAFVERNIDQLSESDGKNQQTRLQLEDTLRKGLRSAIADGLLNATVPSNWR
jgi:hypothetical protein